MKKDFDSKAVKMSFYLKAKVGEKETETEINMEEATELERVIVVQNIFKVFGIENDLSQMIDDYAKIGKAYHSFFSETDSIEDNRAQTINTEELIDVDAEKRKAKTAFNRLADAYEEAKKDKAVETFDNKLSKIEPEHYRTGILKEEGKPDKYQCRYKCKCGQAKTLYIPDKTKNVRCNQCYTTLKVSDATSVHLQADSYNNFFVAGEFKPATRASKEVRA